MADKNKQDDIEGVKDGLHVFNAVSQITDSLSKTGIAKGRKAPGLGYEYRGIDDVYNALSSRLGAHKLCIAPNVVSCERTAITTRNGSKAAHVLLTVNYSVTSGVDGSSFNSSVISEAIDTSDKALNKAMSNAYKNLAFQLFCIPVGPQNDVEYENHEIDFEKVKENAVKEQQSRPVEQRYFALVDALNKAHNIEVLEKRWSLGSDLRNELDDDQMKNLTEAYETKKTELEV